MDLGDQGDAPDLEPFVDVDLLKRTISTERGAGDLTDDVVHLAATAGRRNVHRPDVKIQIEVAVLAPHRVVQAVGWSRFSIVRRKRSMLKGRWASTTAIFNVCMCAVAVSPYSSQASKRLSRFSVAWVGGGPSVAGVSPVWWHIRVPSAGCAPRPPRST